MLGSRLNASRLLILVLAVVLMVPIVSTFMTPAEPLSASGSVSAVSVQGSDRFATAVQSSKLAFPRGADTVIIATGTNWPDALGGTSLAGAVNAPILLVEKNSVPSVVLSEIHRLKAKKAIILGGTAAVSSRVQTNLESFLPGGTERISGDNRYATAYEIAMRVITERGDDFDGKAFVATGENFPDALAAAPVAAAKGWPLFLADPRTGLSAESRVVVSEMKEVFILGGPAVVNPATEVYLRVTCERVTRLGGDDRYKTAVLVAKHAVNREGLFWDGVGITRGDNFPDALAGGVLQGTAKSVMLLTPTTGLDSTASQAIRMNRGQIDTVRYYGGTSAVSTSVRSAVSSVISTPLNLTPVSFADANLQAVVRATLIKPSGTITVTDMERLESLQAAGLKIGNLGGLQYASNLKELSLEINQITDVSQLKNLKRLEWVGLSGNQITDISPLAANTGLNSSASVDVRKNKLNLAQGSAASNDINTLMNRGVWVTY